MRGHGMREGRDKKVLLHKSAGTTDSISTIFCILSFYSMLTPFLKSNSQIKMSWNKVENKVNANKVQLPNLRTANKYRLIQYRMSSVIFHHCSLDTYWPSLLSFRWSSRLIVSPPVLTSARKCPAAFRGCPITLTARLIPVTPGWPRCPITGLLRSWRRQTSSRSASS